MSETRVSPRRLLNAKEVAAKLSCSFRHVLRLTDAGKMPAPTRLGRLVRWDESIIDNWIAEGCRQSRAINTLK